MARVSFPVPLLLLHHPRCPSHGKIGKLKGWVLLDVQRRTSREERWFDTCKRQLNKLEWGRGKLCWRGLFERGKKKVTCTSPCILPTALPQFWPVIPHAELSTASSSSHSPLSPLPVPVQMSLPLGKAASPHHEQGQRWDFASLLQALRFILPLLWLCFELAQSKVTAW